MRVRYRTEARSPPQFRVIPDDVCVPEFHPWRLKKLAGDQALYLDGWMKQQVFVYFFTMLLLGITQFLSS